jgi:hypothetical protein
MKPVTQLLPVDDARKDPSFARFRQDLLVALKRKDASFLLKIVDPNIRNGFGGNDGIAAFKKDWRLSDPRSPFWETMTRTLSLGGSFQTEGKDKTFWAPYTYSNWPESRDAFEYAVVTDAQVAVRSQPTDKSPVLETLRYNFVRPLDVTPAQGKPRPWTKVKTDSGKTGYIPTKSLRSSLDYRAGFTKINGNWRLVIFVAGD